MSTQEDGQENETRHQCHTMEDEHECSACCKQEVEANYQPDQPPSQLTTATEADDQEKKRRHQRHFNFRVCPACGLSIRRQELEAHHQTELEQLERLTLEGSRHFRYPVNRKRRRTKTAEEEDEEGLSSEQRYEEYHRLRRKRETRLRTAATEVSGGASTSGHSSAATRCPVCGIMLAGTPEEMNRHAEACLIKQTEEGDEETDIVNIDDDEDESFEEYTWCGETRIRATTLLEGGLQGCGYKTVRTAKDEGELDVEGDESAEFGPIQYTEENLIHLQDSPESDPPSPGSLQEGRRSNINHDRGQQSVDNVNGGIDNNSAIVNGNHDDIRPDRFQCTVSLSPTEGIKHLRKQLQSMKQELQAKSTIRCLVCLDTYKNPVVSIQCWHVYCEDCWMRTLGAKKLCPQCQMITSPSQLRMIYL